MGAQTKIQWAHSTMNFWLGCTEVSAACDFCYARDWAKRAGRPELWQGDRQRTSAKNWEQPYKWNALAKAAGERHRVFVNSLSDFFDNQVPEEWRHDAFRVIRDCPHLDWLLLTKRPQNIMKLAADFIADGPYPRFENVWLGTTVESQHEAARRIPHLIGIPAAVHFLSMEPLLERVSITMWAKKIDLAIIGGESGGKNRRGFRYSWALDLINQCREAGGAVFVKQVGSAPIDDISGAPTSDVIRLRDKKGGDPREWPEKLRVRELPKQRVAA